MSRSASCIGVRGVLVCSNLIAHMLCACSTPQEQAPTPQVSPVHPNQASPTRSAGTEAGANAAAGTAANADRPVAEAGHAGQAGHSQAGAAGWVPAEPAKTDNDHDDDAGAMQTSGMEVTILAEASFANVTLTANGATCAAGRCTLAPPADGQLKVALTVERSAGNPMPVLARWQGCEATATQFFPVTPSGTEYILNYESDLSGLEAGTRCSAEIVEGGWLTFAGNMSLKILDGEPYCALLQVSQMGVNASCFPPPGTRVEITSDLPRWDCVSVELDGTVRDESYLEPRLSLMSQANQLISCTGAAQ